MSIARKIFSFIHDSSPTVDRFDITQNLTLTMKQSSNLRAKNAKTVTLEIRIAGFAFEDLSVAELEELVKASVKALSWLRDDTE